MNNPIRFLSVCSGMEAASVAWEPLGFKAVGFSEIEPFPCAILKHRFPNTPNYGSLTEYQSWPLEPGSIDLLVGGTPCQSFSVAGLRKGMSDPRGNLALTFLGLADKLRPRWIVWENVPGVLSSNGGRDFGAFLGALGQLGYGWAYRVLDAQHFGVPQRRRRVFVVATSSGDGRLAGEVLSLPEGLRGYLEARQQKRKGPAADAGEGVDGDGGKRISQYKSFTPSSFAQYTEGVGTIRANGGDLGGGSEGLIVKPLMFKVRGGVEANDGSQGGEVGKTAGKGFLGSEDKAFTLAATQDQWLAQTPPMAVQPPIPFRKAKRAQSTTDDESWVEGEVSNTLNNFDLGDTRTTHAVVEPIGIQNTLIGRSEKSGPDGPGVVENGPMFTITKQGGPHGVAHCSDVAPTVTSSGPPYSRTGNERVEAEALVTEPIAFTTEQTPKSKTDQAFTLTTTSPTGGGHPQCVMPPSMAVRRLTPVECERLQGFPDNWSRIPWKGKPEEDCPDGPRYKACGNSMAVPVMRWIGKRIQEVEGKAK